MRAVVDLLKRRVMGPAMVFFLAGSWLSSTGAPALAQVPDWVTGDKEIATEYQNTRGKPINLALMFVSTQASQVADAQGEYPEPWTRVYALKDYYDMARLLQEYPGIKLSISLSPGLLEEIRNMVEGYDRWQAAGRPSGVMRGCDRWLRLSLTPVEELSREDRLYIAGNFFRLPGRDLEHYHGGWARLKELRGPEESADPSQVLARLGEDGLRDLIAWFNLAIFDPDFLAGKITLAGGEELDLTGFAFRVKGFTRDDINRIVDAQFKVLRSLVPLYRALQDEGRLELIAAPYYDPILPLLIDPSLAEASSPGMTRPQLDPSLAADAERQLVLAKEQYERLFGRPPRSVWLGAGGAELPVASLLVRHGFSSVVADHDALRATTVPGRPHIGERKRYSTYELKVDASSLCLLFQDPEIIRDFVEIYSARPWLKAANIFMVRLRQQQSKLAARADHFLLGVVLPLDAYWAEFDNDGKDFLHSVFHQLEGSSWLNLVTPSSYLAADPGHQPTNRFSAGNSTTRIYTRWMGSDTQNAAWRELSRVRAALEETRRQGTIPGNRLDEAARLILRAEGRDILAGYGAGGEAAREADELLRRLLQRAYELMGRQAPAELTRTSGLLSGAAGSP